MITGIVTLILSFFYSAYLIRCFYLWSGIEDRSEKKIESSNCKVTVVVPVRNESKNLPELLRSLNNQNYSKDNFRVIVSDDHSTDDTVAVAEAFFSSNKNLNGVCISSKGLMKKSAIESAIALSNEELIVTTDADVIVDNEWIASLVNEYEKSGACMICGPVKLTGGKTFFEKIQTIEFAGLLAIGAAELSVLRPMYCNGANLAFKRELFLEVGGFENSRSASGDDTQLLMKIHKLYPDKISFLKDKRAIVKTGVVTGLAGIFNQRKRWASKIPGTLSFKTIAIASLAWLFHFMLLFQFFVSVDSGEYLFFFLSIFLKVTAEIFFLKSAGDFFSIKVPVYLIAAVQPFYWLYIFIVGLTAPFGSYKWKERSVR
jgi:cellulose synthase/poly-beta-1,6-N-acetylglucosamine synthase-like glycosyltransferase